MSFLDIGAFDFEAPADVTGEFFSLPIGDFAATGLGLSELPGAAFGDIFQGAELANPALYDFSGLGDLGAFDFGPAPVAPPFASDLSGYQFNTTTGQVVGPGGYAASPEEIRRLLPGLPAFGAGPPSSGYASEPTGYVASATELDRMLREQAAGLGAPGAEAGGGAAPLGTLGGILSRANEFLGTPLGRLAASAGIGLAGLGLQRAVAGAPPRLDLPRYTPSPVTQAGQQAVLNAFQRGVGPQLTETLQLGVGGQRALAEALTGRVGREAAAEAEAAPFERATRLAALGLAPGLVGLTPEVPFTDPVQQALEREILSVISGTGVSPATEQRQQREEEAVRSTLLARLGRDYELTTPGIQALNELRQRQNAERFAERQATLARLTPLQESRMRFAAAFPTEQAAGRQSLRRQALGDVERLSTFGLRGVPENVTALRSLVPLGPLFGGDAERERLINLQLESQAALEGFRQAGQERRELAQGIGSLAGTVAGTLAARPRRTDELLERALAQSLGGLTY